MAIAIWGGSSVPLGIAEIHGKLTPAVSGVTSIVLPPFGMVSASTHHAPLHLTIRIEQLHVDGLLEWMKNGPSREETMHLLQREVMHFARILVLQALLVALLGAFFAGVLLGVRRWRLVAASCAGLVAVAVPIGLTALTYQPEAFSSPTYHGELAKAPELLQAAQLGWKNYASVQDRLPVIVDRITRFYRQLDAVALSPLPPEKDMQRVLLISDLHNNPLGLKFALDLAREYRVDLVCVAGDVTDLGHPLEAQLLQQWKSFHVPVVIVAGNHDSHAIMGKLANIQGLTVLDHGDVATRNGLTIMGFGDPASDRAGVGNVDTTTAELNELGDQIEAKLSTTNKPDILMVHNPRVGRRFLGKIPVILSGHTHSPDFAQRGQSVLVNAGTTGAAGVRFFTEADQLPYGAVVMHFTREQTPR
ncbi:MAG TPA: metallophosphoesterase family protein, partial [Armatimonadota bacterium]|nr:metallophosphoesterase family protein [Armatimonadota bacterium]